MSEISSVWFREGKKLAVGQAIFLRVANKKEQTALALELEKEREDFAAVDPVHASQLFINKTLKDAKQYVTIERKYRAVFTAFFRDTNGAFSKLTVDPERDRILRLMLKDKKPREEIEDVLNGLTEDEVNEFFPETK
jgi:hypothetical protein